MWLVSTRATVALAFVIIIVTCGFCSVKVTSHCNLQINYRYQINVQYLLLKCSGNDTIKCSTYFENRIRNCLKKKKKVFVFSIHTGMIIIQMWTVLFFRRPTALAYVILWTLPHFAILMASSKVTSSRLIVLVAENHLLTFCSVMLRQGPCGGIFVVNSPFVAQARFMTPLCKRMCLEHYNYSLSDGWHATLHHKRKEKDRLSPMLLSLLRFCLLKLHPNIFSPCAEKDFGTITSKRKKKSRDCALCLGYSVTLSEHNRLAINPNFNPIHQEED